MEHKVDNRGDRFGGRGEEARLEGWSHDDFLEDAMGLVRVMGTKESLSHRGFSGEVGHKEAEIPGQRETEAESVQWESQ